MEVTIKVRPPTLREACLKDAFDNLGDYMNPDKECCRNCAFFSPCMMSSPAGWCMKYPSEQVNCSEFDVCDDFDKRKPINGKYLGSKLTDELLNDIRSGEFKEIECGDYFLINGVKYIVVQKNGPDDSGFGNVTVISDKAVELK